MKKFTSTLVYESLHQKNHVANALLTLQSQQFAHLKSRGEIVGQEHYTLTEFLTDLLAKQGGNERIKTFPLPRQYGLFSGLFVWLFYYGVADGYH
ncbi:bestrophin family protein [Spirosoma endophyticum]|uniref:Bestrophin, RFP-TM, chloride channel n=1 Tax=Spirosoma endophyticum TaxID=662367 RepID=A0A1I1VM33_9BACT|nr:bestrophin family ion channel [Spirosoma endophyticum]SFD84066.1 Bestrophin, RFP-TM, chloride channel [Spirosoma endophyticum]